jgi:flavin reductase (DIM6/NTAB) family NADH-FMN oxidoreductase RutF
MIIDPRDTSYQDCYKLMVGSIVPRPIALVSTVSGTGVRNLAPFSYFTAVASKPPTLCFCPGRRHPGGERKDTLSNVEETGEFVVNAVTIAMAERVNLTAADYPADVDEFDVSGLTPIPSERVAPFRVKESPIHLECRVDRVVEIGEPAAGGGALVIGEIVLFHVSDEILTNGRIDIGKLDPLARLSGGDYAALGRRISMKVPSFKPK